MCIKNHYDVIIIGSGAGGGTLAYALAHTGKSILVIERGPHIVREKENWSPRAVFINKRYSPKDIWYDKDNKPFTPSIYYNVGGNTRFYGAALFRLRKEDFGLLHHYEGLSPAWPVTYEEFEPYYTQAETLYAVHGTRYSDPTEPQAKGLFPYPAVSHEIYVENFCQRLSKKGFNPFPMPIGINLNEEDMSNSHCIRCGTCDSFPCMIGAKSDAYTSALQPALDYPNVHIMTDTVVDQIIVSPSGNQVTKVIAHHNGECIDLIADIVVVACGAINSAALLLRSVSDLHPYGLGNNNDLVGRRYMGHGNSTWILALSHKANPTRFPKTMAIHDYYFGESDFPYPMGAIQTVGKVSGTILKTKAPYFISEGLLNKIAHHSIALSVTSEDLPLAENRIALTREGHIQLHYYIHNRKGHERLVRKFLRTLYSMGYFCLTYNLNIGDVAHQCGTLSFGHDPLNSVLDINCRIHGVDNLYVVDSSFFVSSAAVNPALTVIANALRVGKHLEERIR
jgi:choline dehydrogenase-like flavoprotein